MEKSAVFHNKLLPYLLLRIVRRISVVREVQVVLQPSSSLVIGALAVVFALTISAHIGHGLDLTGSVVVLALTVMLSMKLIGFLMLTVRHEAISHILGLLILENGIFLGAQILVPGMPLLIELVIHGRRALYAQTYTEHPFDFLAILVYNRPIKQPAGQEGGPGLDCGVLVSADRAGDRACAAAAPGRRGARRSGRS